MKIYFLRRPSSRTLWCGDWQRIRSIESGAGRLSRRWKSIVVYLVDSPVSATCTWRTRKKMTCSRVTSSLRRSRYFFLFFPSTIYTIYTSCYHNVRHFGWEKKILFSENNLTRVTRTRFCTNNKLNPNKFQSAKQNSSYFTCSVVLVLLKISKIFSQKSCFRFFHFLTFLKIYIFPNSKFFLILHDF